ncbi:MAG: hypothetical protein D6785_16730 [Planctomycetota bacterium]|nr:MAG: hypothetical protein D6785_16730 [Planctomycetota bacterium]
MQQNLIRSKGRKWNVLTILKIPLNGLVQIVVASSAVNAVWKNQAVKKFYAWSAVSHFHC